MPIKDNLRVLIAPLDWGLGHATRCIPIIKYLLESNCTVIIAAAGAPQKLLEVEFPQLHFVFLKGYEIKYSRSKRLLPVKILCQLPGILTKILKERIWLRKIVNQHRIDAVISDNRFGLSHRSVPSFFITHQLQIKGPNKWIETFLRVANYHFINSFKACWVPDFEGEPNLAGTLSHSPILPQVSLKYLGTLSRFEAEACVIKYDLLIVISGPEPQRTIFEKKILNDLKHFDGVALMVRGLPGEAATLPSFNQVQIKNHLNAAELEQAFNESGFILSRAGYTTLMDVIKLKKKAILVPTPGQTEQEYLAAHLQQQSICIAFDQQEFSLEGALEKARSFDYRFPSFNMYAYKEVLDDFLKSLRS